MNEKDEKDERDERDDLPPLSYISVTRGMEFGGEKYCNALSILECMHKTILYALTGWDCYMRGVSGMEVMNPEYTSPPGVIMRFVSFISNPGSSVSQVELIRSPDGHYRFWVFGAKISRGVSHEYKDTDYNLDDFIYLLLRIVSPWNGVDKTLVSRHMATFQADTHVCNFRPQKWTAMCALLHHGLVLTRDIPRSVICSMGWEIDYEDGNHLRVSFEGRELYDYGCSIRGAIGDFFQGKMHQRSCKTSPCDLCFRNRVREILYYVCTDMQTLILDYVK